MRSIRRSANCSSRPQTDLDRARRSDRGPTTHADGAAAATDASRGQTLQDYVVGLTLFVVTLGLVLSAFLGFLDPFSASADGGDVTQSQRISETMVQNLSTGQPPNELHAGDVQSTLDQSATRLRSRWGIPETSWFNVTLTTLNGSDTVQRSGQKLTAGRSYETGGVARTVRIVSLSDDTCSPSCRLVVRVW